MRVVEDHRLFWLHPIWTQLIKERGFDWMDETWANTTDAMRKKDVH